jgi:hypothetical protein
VDHMDLSRPWEFLIKTNKLSQQAGASMKPWD